MFRLITTPDGPVWRCVLFERRGITHGFSTRAHHVGPGEAGRAVIAKLAGVDPSRVVLSRQVHGATVTRDIEPAEAGEREADGHVATAAGRDDALSRVVAVRTADCVPVLLAEASGRAVAAVHAGWRGLDAGVIGEAVRVLREAAGPGEEGVETVRVLAAVGPCISVAAYEVGEEVASRFRVRFPGAVRDDSEGFNPSPPGGGGRRSRPVGESASCEGDASAPRALPGHAARGRPSRGEGGSETALKPHLDLSTVARHQLIAAGLADSDLAVHPGCTFTDAAAFHSYRREGQGVGHQAAWIGTPVTPTGGGRR